MGRAMLLLVIGIAPASRNFGQSQPVAPTFEVASVKPSPPGHSPITSLSDYGTGQFAATNISLQLLLQIAYGVANYQITSAPSWRDEQRYDILAKPEDGVRLTPDQLRPRLQQLLEQRFKLAVHRGMKNFDCYVLVVAKGGPKLEKANSDPSGRGIGYPGGLRLPNSSMDGLASMLVSPAGRPVVDKTGITGTYDIVLDYARDGDTNASLPSLFTALQEQLGLKLEARKLPLEMLVIDHVERIPTEN